jgi:hypothetical protein
VTTDVTTDVRLGGLVCPFGVWRPPDGRVLDRRFAFDTETTALDDDRPYLTPAYVVGAACDGSRGVFVGRDDVLPFLQAHAGLPLIFHNAAFDLKVLDALLRPRLDVYAAVDAGRVWDTLVLKRLHSLATAGHPARGSAGLADCARDHLGVALDKGGKGQAGGDVRTGFGRFLGQPPSAIPAGHLAYLAGDARATWHLFGELHRLIKGVLAASGGVYGHAGDAWLRDAVARFGPLTHHVQLRASILMDRLRAEGIGVDRERREEKAAGVRALLEDRKERLRRGGLLVDQPGNGKALQNILGRFHHAHPDVELRRTASGQKWSTAEEDLAERDGFFAAYADYRAAEKLLSTYMSKMGPDRLHARFGYLLATGRTYCGGGFNLQNLPREKGEKDAAATVRGCFVPRAGHVFIDSDYSQVELVVLGHALRAHFGLPSRLAGLVNSGEDVHRLIAAAVLGKAAAEVSKAERDSAKPVSFGRPGGMGPRRLQAVAKAGYNIDLTLEEVEGRIQAYHALCPELATFLRDEVDTGEGLARALGLTPQAHAAALGRPWAATGPEASAPAGWLGGMALKTLRDEAPCTRQGRPYRAEEVALFWEGAQALAEGLDERALRDLRDRRPGRGLWGAARALAGRRSVFTLTGRLRAGATFCSARNNVFQGPAADGAILGLWKVWRAGHRAVSFVHDQVVVEAPADGAVPGRVRAIEGMLREGMLEVVPGMRVGVESVVTRSLHKGDLDPRYRPAGRG